MDNNRSMFREDKTQVASANITPEIIRLVERAVSGDLEAFGQLYDIYLDRIYRYVFYQVKNKMVAEDIVEEVFVKVWKAIGSCKGREKTFSSWIYRIAHNQVIDNFRSRRKELLTDMETAEGISDPKQEIERKFEEQALLQMISYLPQNQKQVILLKFIENLDNREIGQLMGKSQGAVRILQMRALTALRERLGSAQ